MPNEKSQQEKDEYNARIQPGLTALLRQTENGDWPPISFALTTLADILADHSVLSPANAEWLAEKLRNLASGQDHIAAFGIRRKRGEKANVTAAYARAHSDAYMVEKMSHEYSWTKEKAIAYLAQVTNTPEDTIARHWKKYHRQVKREFGY